MKKSSLVMIGGVVVLVLSASHYWFEMRRPPVAVLVPKAINADMDELARRLEAYRSEKGNYPTALADLSAPNVSDWGTVQTTCRRQYSYAVSPDGKAAAIGSVGLDGVPNTTDDAFYSTSSEVSDVARELLGTKHGAGACIRVAQ